MQIFEPCYQVYVLARLFANFCSVICGLLSWLLAGMLMRPEYHEAKAQAKKCEAEAKKNLARLRSTSMRPRP